MQHMQMGATAYDRATIHEIVNFLMSCTEEVRSHYLNVMLTMRPRLLSRVSDTYAVAIRSERRRVLNRMQRNLRLAVTPHGVVRAP